MTRRRDLGTYQMLWDCGYCGTAKLLALDHRHCPSCGVPQDPERRYFPSEEDKVAVQDHQFVGADWQCPSCDAPNAKGAAFCVNCGAGREDGQTIGHREDRVAGAGASFASDDVRQAAREAKARRQAEREARQAEYEARRAAAGGRAPPRKAKGGGKGKVILWVGIVAVAFILMFLFWKETTTVTVAGHTWTRAIDIERFQAVEDAAWCDETPGDAYSVSRRREKSGTRRVEDGETCQTRQQDQGDGTFKEVEECSPTYREEAVYDQKCYFRIDRWVTIRTEEAAGTSLTDVPYWPDVNLAQTGARLGAERQGEASERYVVIFRIEDGETHDCAFPEDKWRRFAVGQSLDAQVGGLTGNVSCGSF